MKILKLNYYNHNSNSTDPSPSSWIVFLVLNEREIPFDIYMKVMVLASSVNLIPGSIIDYSKNPGYGVPYKFEEI